MTATPMTAVPELVPFPALPDGSLDADRQAHSPSEAWAVVPQGGTQAAPAVRVMLVEELERVASHIGELLAPDKRVRLVETVTDSGQATERIANERPDLVIIDALMQGDVSGADVARRLRAAGQDMPIVFLTVPDRPLSVRPELGEARCRSTGTCS
jgi:CheY-like chemotaxis protein